MDIISNAQNIKIFKSQYDGNTRFWNGVKASLIEEGYSVYDKKQDCDVAIILDAFMINPSAFERKVGFVHYIPDERADSLGYNYVHFVMPVLTKYFNTIINMHNMTIKGATDYIMKYIRHLEGTDEAA